jgi:hypothetical protein
LNEFATNQLGSNCIGNEYPSKDDEDKFFLVLNINYDLNSKVGFYLLRLGK